MSPQQSNFEALEREYDKDEETWTAHPFQILLDGDPKIDLTVNE